MRFNFRNNSSRKNCCGAATTQYAIALGILIVVFIAAADYLETARANRATSATSLGADIAPCGEALSGAECE